MLFRPIIFATWAGTEAGYLTADVIGALPNNRSNDGAIQPESWQIRPDRPTGSWGV